MRRTIAIALIAAILLAVPAFGAGPSVTKLVRDVATALKTAKRADVNARRALAATGTQGPSGAAGSNGAAGSDGAKGAAGSDGARGVDGEDGSAGSKGDTGEQGTAVGFAHANFDSLDAEHSSSNVTMHRGENGSVAYCFDVVDAVVRSAVVSLDGSMFVPNSVRAFVEIPARDACGGGDVSVVLSDPSSGPQSGGFWVLFE